MLVHQVRQGGRPRAVVLVHECLGLHRDVRDILDAHRLSRGNEREEASHGYHPRCGGCYDSGEDRNPSPGLLGPQAFSRHILNAAFPPRYRPPTNILKNTLGKRTLDCGSRIIGLPAKPMEWIMTISLSATIHCSWPIRHECGWNSFCPTESKVDRT